MLAITPFTEAARTQFLDYLLAQTSSDQGRKRLTSVARYEETIKWITTDRKPTNSEEKGRRHRARADFRVHNGSLYRRNPNGDEGLRVAHILLAFEFIAACHKAALHKGVKKTYTLVSERYYGISRDDVAALLKHCEICALNRPSRTRAPLTPIVVEEWLERIQIDLIDLRAEADGHMKWICHIKDHFTKYSILFATPTKASDEIAKCVSIFMMFFGIPDVFQADNGAEFKRWVLRLVHNHGVKVRNGRPRTPHIQGLVEQGNNSVKDSLRAWKAEAGRKDWSAALPEICWSMNATYHRSIKTTPYELVFGRRFNWRNHLSHHSRVTYLPPDEEIPLEEQDAQRELDSDLLCPPSGDFTFQSYRLFPSATVVAGPSRTRSASTGSVTSVDTIQLALRGGLPNYQSQGSFDVPQLSTNLPLEPLPLLIDPQLTVPAGAGDTPSASKESTRFSTPLSPVPASSHPPSPCGSEATIPDTIGSASHTSNIRNREMSARTNLATARTNMAGKYNRHHQVESFAIGQYVTIRIPREDRAATDNKRILCRVVDIAGSDGRPGYKLRCQYGLLQKMCPTSALASVSAAIQKEKGELISLSNSGNEITLAHAASKASTSNKAGVSCNCKKSCDTRRCRCFKNSLQCSIYCHNDDYDCGNLKPLAQRTELSLVPRDSWELSDSRSMASDTEGNLGAINAATPSTTPSANPSRPILATKSRSRVTGVRRSARGLKTADADAGQTAAGLKGKGKAIQ